MASNEERMQRAREIVAEHEISGLDYMTENPLAEDSEATLDRFMIVTHTDHSADHGDAWIETVGTPVAMVNQVSHLLRDEWGLHGVWDLDSEDYLSPLPVSVAVSVEVPGVPAARRDMTIKC